MTIEYTEVHEPHDDQVQVWVGQVSDALEPWLARFDDDDDKLDFWSTLEIEIKSIAEAAHAAGMMRRDT